MTVNGRLILWLSPASDAGSYTYQLNLFLLCSIYIPE